MKMFIAISILFAAIPIRAPLVSQEVGTKVMRHGSLPNVIVTVDSARSEVRLTVGPLHFDPLPAGESRAHAMHHVRTEMFRFVWPVEGWLEGMRLSIHNARGRPLSRDLMHLILVNFSRRDFVHGGLERLMGFARETEDVALPPIVGVPMSRGMQLGLYAKRHYVTPLGLDSVYVELTLPWRPASHGAPTFEVLPLYVDTRLEVGGTNEFDVPPGHFEERREFTVAEGGSILGVSGHLHRYGTGLRVEDAETGRTIIAIAARQDSIGQIRTMERRVFWVDAPRLEAHHRYRVVGVYDNPTGDTLRDVMAHVVGVFRPDDVRRVPGVDLSDPIVRRDITDLAREGTRMTSQIVWLRK